MPLPVEPRIPQEPVPVHVDAVLDIQRRAAFWTRLSVLGAVVLAATAIGLTWRGMIHWTWILPVLLFPLVPISAQTRVDELRQKVLDQVRDVQNDELRRDAVKGDRKD